MAADSDFAVHCIVNVLSPTISLSRRKETGAYYCHIPVPISEQLVIFCEGQWEHTDDYDVTLTYKDDEICLGQVSKSNRSLCWRRDGSVLPQSMSSDSEKGLAKLLLEKSEGPPLLVNMVEGLGSNDALDSDVMKNVNENTPQLMEQVENTPERPLKTKRKSNLNKEDKTPNGPSAKKQKIQKQNTRVRTPKSDTKQENSPVPSNDVKGSVKQSKQQGNSPVPSKDIKGGKQNKQVNSPVPSKDVKGGAKLNKQQGHSPVPSKDIKGGKQNKQVNSPVPSKDVKGGAKLNKQQGHSPVPSKDVKGGGKQNKQDNSPVPSKDVKGGKQNKQDNSPVPSKDVKGGKQNKAEKANKGESKIEKTMNSESKIESSPKTNTKQIKLKYDQKSVAKVTKTEQKMDKSPTVKETKIGKKKLETKIKEKNSSEVKEKKSKKMGKDSETENEPDKCDKENVHIDRNLPVTEDKTCFKNTSPKDTSLTPVKENPVSSKSLQQKNVASCKDLTSRVLACPSGRWGHSLCFVNKNLSVLIGGQGEKQQLNKDSVWTLDAETRRWKNPTTQSEGQKPEYRMGHTATYDPMVRCVYVFGGSKNTRWFHDVHILDIEEWKWQLVKVNGKAPTRAYHSATLYRHELWIFGGVYPRPDPQPDGCSNDINIFSPVMESWYDPIVKGDKPEPRSGHSATLLNDQLVVFGGWDAPFSYSNLYVLDMSIVEWSQPKTTGSPPSPRSWHASCALSCNRVLIHGGYNGDIALEDTHIFNLDEFNWTQIKVENNPPARVGHKAICMPYRHDNEEEDEIIIFGGGDNDGAYFDDLLSIYVPFEPTAVL